MYCRPEMSPRWPHTSQRRPINVVHQTDGRARPPGVVARNSAKLHRQEVCGSNPLQTSIRIWKLRNVINHSCLIEGLQAQEAHWLNCPYRKQLNCLDIRKQKI